MTCRRTSKPSMNPVMLTTMLVAVAVFATVLALAMPVMQRDRLNQAQKVMAVERDKMRSQALQELAAKSGGNQGKLRQTPKLYAGHCGAARPARSVR